MSVFGVSDSKEVKIWPQVLTIFTVCLSSITSGLFFGWSSPFLVKITQDKINYDITEDEASIMVYIHFITIVLFSGIGAKLNDILGRKKCLLLMAVPQIAFWIITAFARSIYMFYFARFTSGISDALQFSTLPMYIAEIATPTVRGSWGNIVVFQFVGQFLMNVIGLNFSVQQSSYICISLPIVYLLLTLFLPESPYYSIMKGREEEAKKSLRFLRAKKDVEEEYLEIKAAITRQMSETSKWTDLVCIKSNRKAVIAAIFLRISQQFSGIGAIEAYMNFIFEKSGSSIDPALCTIITSAIFGLSSVPFGFIGERLGRRIAYTTSMATCSVILTATGIFFYLDQNTNVNISSIKWFPLVGIIGYVICSGVFGILSIPTLMSGELFPNNVKTKAFSIQLILLGSLLAVCSVVFYEMNARFGLAGPFLLFGVSCFVSTFLSFCFIPETKGKTLEEIQLSLKRVKNEENI